MQQVPAQTAESDAMSRDLKRRGFTFVGSTICYAFMQATGMVNDHLVGCFRHGEIESQAWRAPPYDLPRYRSRTSRPSRLLR